MPRHSVIMPVLNGQAFVREGIASALAQLAPDDEVIVIDNGSTDQTRQIVQAYQDTRIKLLHEVRKGPAAARNSGIRAAGGDFISFLDHDDLWPEQRLSGLLTALTGNATANAAYGRVRVRYDAGHDARFRIIDGRHTEDVLLLPYIFRRDLIERAGPMDETLIQGEDLDYFPRLRASAMVCAVYEGYSGIYRRHATNMTRDPGDTMQAIMQVLARNIARRRNRQKP